jgi:hypothetical protein
VTRAASRLVLPPTRNHRQLAAFINAHKLVDDQGRLVVARVDHFRTNTDRKIRGTRLRVPGKGRQGLVLEIWPIGADTWRSEQRLYRHESGETYRRHSEARAWVEQNLRRAP